jgi:hypothetical protein
MAKIEDDSILNHMLGMLGKQIVIKRSKSGKRYISAKPEYDPNRKLTKNQLAYAEKFLRQVSYAKAACRVPELKKLYAAKARPGCTPYIMAWCDAHYPPVIRHIIHDGYHGREGDVLFINVDDDCKVSSVLIVIYNDDGDVIEEGKASQQSDNIWTYTTKTNMKGSSIVCKAYDLPKNETVRSLKL